MTRPDIEEQIGVALADHAGEDVHVESLLARVTAQGRTLRNRRRAVAVAGVAALATAAVGVASVVPTLWREDVAPPAPAATITDVPAAPVLENRPARPEDVGAHPMRIHFRLTRIPALPVQSVVWANHGGYESVHLRGSDAADTLASVNLLAPGQQVSHEPPECTRRLAPGSATPTGDAGACTKLSEESVTVSGKPGTLTSYGRGGRVLWRSLTWTVLPTITGSAFADDAVSRDSLLGLAEAVRTDRVSRCAVPFRLTQPSPVIVTDCSMSLSVGGGSATGTLEIVASHTGGNARIVPWRGGEGKPQRKIAHATPSPGVPPASRDEANRQVDGKPALWTRHDRQGPEDGGQLLLFAAADLIIEFYVWGGYGEADALSMAAGYQPAQGNDPADWPTDPLS